MIYFQQQVHQNLKDFIRCYWQFENNSDGFLSYTIFPDGFFDLLICYHENHLEEVVLTGLWNLKTSVVIAPKTTIYGVQFRLLAIEGIIQDGIAEMLNSTKKLEKSYLGIDEFEKNIGSFFFQHMNKQFLSLIEKHNPIDSRQSTLLKSIDGTKGDRTIKDYSRIASWSPRQINRYFQSTFGLSLKTYCGIRKGASNYGQIKRGQLYPQQGYFDQSHFIKEIKKITGFTPKALFKNDNDRFLQFSIIENK